MLMKYFLIIFLFFLIPAVINATSIDFKLRISDYGKTGTVIIWSSLLENPISLDNLAIKKQSIIIRINQNVIPIEFTPVPGQILEITLKKL